MVKILMLEVVMLTVLNLCVVLPHKGAIKGKKKFYWILQEWKMFGKIGFFYFFLFSEFDDIINYGIKWDVGTSIM
jgi:hypothetical protein